MTGTTTNCLGNDCQNSEPSAQLTPFVLEFLVRSADPNRRLWLVVHVLPNHVETGRWSRTPLEDRTCPCGAGIQTEQHMLLTCPATENLRAQCPATQTCRNIGRAREIFKKVVALRASHTRILVALNSCPPAHLKSNSQNFLAQHGFSNKNCFLSD